MTKYLLKRLLHGLFSVVCVVAIVMILVYSLMDRTQIFAQDPVYSKQQSNAKVAYQYRKWEEYGYLDYVPYTDWLGELKKNGEITEEEWKTATSYAPLPEKDSDEVKVYVDRFTEYYRSRGYEVVRLPAVYRGNKVVLGGQKQFFAYKNTPLPVRLWRYFSGLITVDNIHYVEEDIENRGLTFTWHDPVYGGEKFSPAIMGNGTKHKYLLYFDSNFPFIHQNIVSINLGKSYTVNQGVDVYTTMTSSQGAYVKSDGVVYPTGFVEPGGTADDLHSATYMAGSRDMSAFNQERFTDDYTNVRTVKSGFSKIGYSFLIGICSVVMAYLLGLPLGVMMARKKDKLVDKIGTIYIVFIIAVPSLAYIFLFKAIGGKMGLPTTFMLNASRNPLMYILPIVSLALPSIASLMKWLRRYMIDQMNSDYVKFARAGGLSEGEIFRKHILKNAVIPIVHGIPGSVLGALTGAIITERVYVVPGAGNLLTEAINKYDNGVIIGVTLFYALLSIVSIILGDILMSMVDPRISFSSKAR